MVCSISSEFVGNDNIGWQQEFYPAAAGVNQQLFGQGDLVKFNQGLANAVTLSGKKSICHTAANEQQVHF